MNRPPLTPATTDRYPEVGRVTGDLHHWLSEGDRVIREERDFKERRHAEQLARGETLAIVEELRRMRADFEQLAEAVASIEMRGAAP
jgi:hypothetical protein